MNLKLSSKKVVELILKGDIDIEDIIALKGIITSFIEKENLFFSLDFAKVEHLNISGIEYLNERKERLRSLGGDLKIIGCNEHVKNLFIYAGYIGEFDFYDNEEEAMKSFEKYL
ncbi:MAG: STAS domain-containing protein [Candidatus Goldbacteria bacterium]|nr:STAS domain-containing protein [Candidatus Goldiibacteriota bacterium]